MEDTPICASVERDLELLFDEITGPRPDWTPAAPELTPAAQAT